MDIKIPQYNLGKLGHYGAMYFLQLQNSSSYIGIVNYFLLASTFWSTSQDSIKAYIPWMSFPLMFVFAVLILFILLPLLDYMFVRKSVYAAQNIQACEAGHPLLEEILANQKLIMEKLGIRSDNESKTNPPSGISNAGKTL